MKKIYRIGLFSLICFVMSIGIMITSCTKDDSTDSSSVKLLSFGPSGVEHGDTISFIGNNLDKVTAIKLVGDSILRSSFLKQTSSLITLVVPDDAMRGLVKLYSTQGVIVSKSILDLKVPVTVTSMTKGARPGENITITGTFMNWVNEVVFAKNISVTKFVSQSLTELVVTIPVNAQTGNLVLYTGGTKPLTIRTDSILNVTLPSISEFSPSPVYAGSNLTITGNNLDLTKGILFNGVSDTVKSFVSITATQLVVTVPQTTKKGAITLTAYSGVPVVSISDLTIVLPSITSFTPNPVDRGSNLTITGTDLNLVSGVLFNGADVVTTFVSQSATQIVVAVPASAASGTLKLTAANSGVSISSAVALNINGGLPALAPLVYVMYDDAAENGWGIWAGDGSNTDNVRQGTYSIKYTYDGSWNSLTLGGGSVATGSYTTFTFSIYGTAESTGQQLGIVTNGANWGSPYIFTILSGWNEYNFTLTDAQIPATFNRVDFQSRGWSGVVYMDHIGFR